MRPVPVENLFRWTINAPCPHLSVEIKVWRWEITLRFFGTRLLTKTLWTAEQPIIIQLSYWRWTEGKRRNCIIEGQGPFLSVWQTWSGDKGGSVVSRWQPGQMSCFFATFGSLLGFTNPDLSSDHIWAPDHLSFINDQGTRYDQMGRSAQNAETLWYYSRG